MAERIRDAEDRLLESMFASEAIETLDHIPDGWETDSLGEADLA